MLYKEVILNVRESAIKYDARKKYELKSPGAITEFVAPIFKQYEDEKERSIAIFLNTRNKVIGYNVVSMGTIQGTIVHPREVFRPAIAVGASGIVLAHNHPSGSIKPSEEDVQITERIKRAGEIVGITLLDHVIIGERPGGDESFYSFYREGML